MRSIFNTTLAGLIAVLQAFAPIAHAQSTGTSLPDAEPPIIEIEEIRTNEAAPKQVFTAQVVDDRQLVDVILYHRRAGQQAFTPEPMNALGSTAFFSAVIDTDETDLRPFEYYVQARDEGGNRTVQGYAFDPIVRSLTPVASSVPQLLDTQETASVDSQREAPAEITTRSRIRWWHVALGVVAAGTIAAVAGGSGGSGGGSGTVPLTITLGEPQ